MGKSRLKEGLVGSSEHAGLYISSCFPTNHGIVLRAIEVFVETLSNRRPAETHAIGTRMQRFGFDAAEPTRLDEELE